MKSAKEDQVQPMAHNAKCKGGPGPFYHTAVGIAVGVQYPYPRRIPLGKHQLAYGRCTPIPSRLSNKGHNKRQRLKPLSFILLNAIALGNKP